MESRSAPQSRRIGEETLYLPEQLIMEEILPRLPVKSLLKFRCVAKSWCSLIGSKRFIKAHLKYSIESSWFANNCIFVDLVEKKFKQCSLPSMFDKPFTHPICHIADLGIKISDYIVPVGFCNGLVCILLGYERFILWNPTTKKFRNLPDFYNQIKFEFRFIYKCGFGFDELSDDYKVFGIVIVSKPGDCIGMIYSLRSNSWKRIEETDVSPFGNDRIHVSGKLHWKREHKSDSEIVAFDLNSHVSSEIELPSYAERVLHSIRVIGGCLSVHCFNPNGDLDVWIMKEYGVKESWDKVVTVPHCEKIENPTPFPRLKKPMPPPVAIAPNGEVLLVAGRSTVMIYNPKCDVIKHLPTTALGFAGAVCFLGICTESLVSVAPDANNQAQALD